MVVLRPTEPLDFSILQTMIPLFPTRYLTHHLMDQEFDQKHLDYLFQVSAQGYLTLNNEI